VTAGQLQISRDPGPAQLEAATCSTPQQAWKPGTAARAQHCQCCALALLPLPSFCAQWTRRSLQPPVQLRRVVLGEGSQATTAGTAAEPSNWMQSFAQLSRSSS
jgi:hypothetical protein